MLSPKNLESACETVKLYWGDRRPTSLEAMGSETGSPESLKKWPSSASTFESAVIEETGTCAGNLIGDIRVCANPSNQWRSGGGVSEVSINFPSGSLSYIRFAQGSPGAGRPHSSMGASSGSHRVTHDRGNDKAGYQSDKLSSCQMCLESVQ